MGDMMKKRKIPVPCFTCIKDKKANCNGEKPCNECIKANQTHMCIPSDGNGYGITSKPLSYRSNVSHPINRNQSNPQTKTTSSSSIQPANSYSSTYQNTNNHHRVTNNNNPVQVDVRPISNQTIERPKEVSNGNNHSTEKTGTDLDPQSAINLYFNGELRRLKEEISRMSSEMLAMRIQNMKITSTMEAMRPQLSTATSQQLLLDATAGSGMIVFDLRQHPAIVLTTNDTFCQMLGYSIEEVLGKPWIKFIHPQFIDRTLQILQDRNPTNTTTTFEQVYVTKEGHNFTTIDSHRIFFADGKAVSDLVFVTLSNNSSDLLNLSTSHSSHRPLREIPRLMAPELHSEPSTPIPLDHLHSILPSSTSPLHPSPLSPSSSSFVDVLSSPTFHPPNSLSIESFDDLSHLNDNPDSLSNYHVSTTSPETDFQLGNENEEHNWTADYLNPVEIDNNEIDDFLSPEEFK